MVRHSDQVEILSIKDAEIPDILKTIKIAEKRGSEFITDEFIDTIKGGNDKETFYNLWKKLKSEIKYKADGKSQSTKSPGALWESRVGDCKSFTVFVASVLQKMCIPYDLILDYYDPKQPNMAHIYIKARGVVIDPVHNKFNVQDRAWKRKKIKGIYTCPSVGSAKKNRFSLFIIGLILIIILKND